VASGELARRSMCEGGWGMGLLKLHHS